MVFLESYALLSALYWKLTFCFLSTDVLPLGRACAFALILFKIDHVLHNTNKNENHEATVNN